MESAAPVGVDAEGGRLGRLQLVFRVAQQPCSIPVESVRELLQQTEVNAIPGCLPWVRGVVNIRGQVLSLVDLRLRLGFSSAAVEREALLTMLRQREAEHIAWIDALALSLKEGRPFEGAVDPHACGFGRWYDSFRSPDPILAHHMTRFDEPHKAIHALAARTQALRAKGDLAGALRLVESARGTTLQMMISLFGYLYTLFQESDREIVVLVDQGGHGFALVVDVVDALEHVRAVDLTITGAAQTLPDIFCGVGFRKEGEGVVSQIDLDRLSSELRGIRPAQA